MPLETVRPRTWPQAGAAIFTTLAATGGLSYLFHSPLVMDLGVLVALITAGQAALDNGVSLALPTRRPAREQEPLMPARAAELAALRTRIRKAVAAHGLEPVMYDQLVLIDELVDSFRLLLYEEKRYQAYLAENPPAAIHADIAERERHLPAQVGPARVLAEQNLQVLGLRRTKLAQISAMFDAIVGQLAMLENTVKLIHDQVQTASSPTELGLDVGRLRRTIEATDEAIAETRAMLPNMMAVGSASR